MYGGIVCHAAFSFYHGPSECHPSDKARVVRFFVRYELGEDVITIPNFCTAFLTGAPFLATFVPIFQKQLSSTIYDLIAALCVRHKAKSSIGHRHPVKCITYYFTLLSNLHGK